MFMPLDNSLLFRFDTLLPSVSPEVLPAGE